MPRTKSSSTKGRQRGKKKVSPRAAKKIANPFLRTGKIKGGKKKKRRTWQNGCIDDKGGGREPEEGKPYQEQQGTSSMLRK